MAKMKTLAVDMMEFEDEILHLLNAIRYTFPTAFALMFDDDLSTKTTKEVFRQCSGNEDLVVLTTNIVKMDLVDFGNIPKEPTVLSLKHPELTLLVEDDINT